MLLRSFCKVELVLRFSCERGKSHVLDVSRRRAVDMQLTCSCACVKCSLGTKLSSAVVGRGHRLRLAFRLSDAFAFPLC
jgi:hypothetical protein